MNHLALKSKIKVSSGKSYNYTNFSNEDDLLRIPFNKNFYLYKILCCWPGFIAHHIHLKIPNQKHHPKKGMRLKNENN